jgi:hypothetical protein
MDTHPLPTESFWRSRAGIALLVLGAVAAFFLLSEHWAHALGVAPYLLVLACPLMHVFMHHGRGHGHGHGSPDDRPKGDSR